eukprot:62619_1
MATCPLVRPSFRIRNLSFQVQRCFASNTRNPDYLVVGAGSAGCIVTRRLAEAGNTVTLVEAGPKDTGSWDSWKIQMPSALAFNITNNKYNWDFWSTPQPGLGGRRLNAPRGKALGGSSSLNAMVYVRGHAEDYERWATQTGDESWKYEQVLPYFVRLQHHLQGIGDPDPHNSSYYYRGTDGLLKVCSFKLDAFRELNEAFVNAGIECGYPLSSDFNGFQQEGFGELDKTIDQTTGTRASTSYCYLHTITDEDIKSRINILTKHQTFRLMFDDNVISDDTVVKGIEVYNQSTQQMETLYAEKEVILCAGAVGSVQILQYSGIGDADFLSQFDISSRIHLPDVGQNLEDHLEFYLQYKCKRAISAYPYSANPFKSAKVGVNWLLNGEGICSSNQFDVGGFIRSNQDVLHPDIQYHFTPVCVVGQADILSQHGYQAHCGTLRPTSKGCVNISGSDFLTDAPVIDPQYLTTHKDIADQRASFRLSHAIMESQNAFGYLNGGVLNFEGVDIDNDEQIDEWIRNNSHSAYHLSCSCKMGKVVDPKSATVYGAANLRVIDASIMPSMTSGNLNAPTILLTEKLVDAVLGKDLLPKMKGVTWFKHR